VTDAEAVAQCKAALDETNAVTYGGSDTSTTVRNDITLKTTFSDCSLEWANVSGPISATGEVTRPNPGQANAAAVLRVTVKRNNNAASTEDLNFTVLAADNAAYLQSCVDNLLSAITFVNPETRTTVKSNIILAGTVTGDYGACNVDSWSSSAPSTVSNGGVVARPYDNAVADASVTLTATVSHSGTTTGTVGLTVLKYTVAEEAAILASDLAALTIGYGANDATCTPQQSSCVTNNLTLADQGFSGKSTVTWTSANTSHVSVSGKVGTVTRGHFPSGGATGTDVSLSASLAMGSQSVNGTIGTVTVKPLGTLAVAETTVLTTTGSGKMSVLTSNTATVNSGLDASIRYRVCVAEDGTGLDSVTNMDAIALTSGSSCKNTAGDPLVLPDSSSVCCIASSVGSASFPYFQPPVGPKTWRLRFYAYVLGDPAETEHRVLYNLSDAAP
jgi:hypothetical protein